VATTPRDQLGHVIAGDRGEKLRCAEIFDQASEIALGVISTSVVLASLMPITARGFVERHASAGNRRGGVPDPLALGTFYGLRFPPVCPFRRAVKASTAPLEVEVVERRALGLVDGHDCCAFCRVRLAIQSSMSLSVNIIFSRCLPLPAFT
jgi:hypothetical protein